jgi:hypothetical protein
MCLLLRIWELVGYPPSSPNIVWDWSQDAHQFPRNSVTQILHLEI